MRLEMSSAISAYNDSVSMYESEQTSETKEVRKIFDDKTPEIEVPKNDEIEDKAFISQEAQSLFTSEQEDSTGIENQIPTITVMHDNSEDIPHKIFDEVSEAHPEKNEPERTVEEEVKDQNEVAEKGFTTVEQTLYESNEMFNLN